MKIFDNTGQRSGKTAFIIEEARKHKATIITHSKQEANRIKTENPDLKVLAAAELNDNYLRGLKGPFALDNTSLMPILAQAPFEWEIYRNKIVALAY